MRSLLSFIRTRGAHNINTNKHTNNSLQIGLPRELARLSPYFNSIFLVNFLPKFTKNTLFHFLQYNLKITRSLGICIGTTLRSKRKSQTRWLHISNYSNINFTYSVLRTNSDINNSILKKYRKSSLAHATTVLSSEKICAIEIRPDCVISCRSSI